MEALLQEMCLRSDEGNAFLPFEFSAREADGTETQTEMTIVEVRRYMRDIKAYATAQRWRFIFCLLAVMVALILYAGLAIFVVSFGFKAASNLKCGKCDPSCQTVENLMQTWYNYTPELLPLVTSLSSTLPLIFSLWMMTTPEDRELLLHPSRFLTEEISLNPIATPRQARLKEERLRLGIDLV
jgi:hypothetical protein